MSARSTTKPRSLNYPMGALMDAGLDDRTKRTVREQTNLSILRHHGSTPMFFGGPGGPRTQTRGFEIYIHGRRAGILISFGDDWIFTITNDDGPMTQDGLHDALVQAAQAFDTQSPLPSAAGEAMDVWAAECTHNASMRTKAMFDI